MLISGAWWNAIMAKKLDSMENQAWAQALAKCLEQGGERIQDEAVGFEKALQ